MTSPTNTSLANFLPEYVKNDLNVSVLENLHDKMLSRGEATPLIGYIGDRVDEQYHARPNIRYTDVEKATNSLQPCMFVEHGTEKEVFKFKDTIQALKILGIDEADIGSFLTSSGFNLILPIDIDKFINYSKYYWVGSQTGASRSYNTNLETPDYFVIATGNMSNRWTDDNHWYHLDDLQDNGFSIDDAVQAIRPIFEYRNDLEMNTFVENGVPQGENQGDLYFQQKTSVNQYPLFNLYNLDGTHANKVSPIVYYAESQYSPVDDELERRIVKNEYGDFTIEHGLVDSETGGLYAYNTNEGKKILWDSPRSHSPEFYVFDDEGVPQITDTIDIENGAWKVPDQYFYNIENVTNKQIGFADLIGHFSSIIDSQDGIVGSPVGGNNFRSLQNDMSLGGRIKQFNGRFGLLLGLIHQPDTNALSIIEFGMNEYYRQLNSATEFVNQRIGELLTSGDVQPFDNYIEDSDGVRALYTHFESEYLNLETNFIDSNSNVKNFVLTLPYMGFVPAVKPTVQTDFVTGRSVMIHHDGHKTSIQSSNEVLKNRIANELHERSDGTSTSGTVSPFTPDRPYKNQLWLDTTTNTLKIFKVVADSPDITDETGILAGEYLYDRSNDVVYVYDGSSWRRHPSNTAPWTVVDIDVLSNSLILEIENRLYNGVSVPTNSYNYESHAKYDELMEHEYLRYVKSVGVDDTFTDYSVHDAFTWNYKYSGLHSTHNIEPQARWNGLYKSIYGTERPDLEPWKIQGHIDKPDYWDDYVAGGADVWNDIINNTTPVPAPNGFAGNAISVDPTTGKLLPPYVSANKPEGAFALTNKIPGGINSEYVFGDGGPIETSWKESITYNYSRFKVAFKIDPMVILDTYWGDNVAEFNGYRFEHESSGKISHRSIKLHGEAVEKTSEYDVNVSGNITATDGFSARVIFKEVNTCWYLLNDNRIVQDSEVFTVIDGITSSINSSYGHVNDIIVVDRFGDFTIQRNPLVVLNGIGQWMVNLFRSNNISTSSSINNSILRKWIPRLGYGFDGIVNTEEMTMQASQFSIVDDDIDLLIKKNRFVDVKEITALRLQLFRRGSVKTVNNIAVPNLNGADWDYRIDSMNPEITSIDIATFENSVTFDESGEIWDMPRTPNGTQRINLPVTVKGIQGVIDIVAGYAETLSQQGFVFDSSEELDVDPNTGHLIDWLYEIRRFIKSQFKGATPGSAIIANPFRNTLTLKTDYGMLSNMVTEYKAAEDKKPVIYDEDLVPMNVVDDARIIRTDEKTRIKTFKTNMGGSYYIDSYEHFCLFNNYSSGGTRFGLIYDPFLGVRVGRLLINANVQQDSRGRLTFDGYFINDGKVIKNIDTTIRGLENMYDPSTMEEGSDQAYVARSLLGYSPRDYFDNANISESSKFSYWRGFLKNKGSDNAIDAFLNLKKYENVDIDEFWAYKIAEYGDARKVQLPEIKIQSSDTSLRYLKMDFGDSINPSHVLITETDESRWVNNLDTDFTMPSVISLDIQLDATEIGLFEIPNGETIDYYEVQDVDTGEMLDIGYDVINNTLIDVTQLGGLIRIIGRVYNFDKLNPIELRDYVSNTKRSDLYLWDPARGHHDAVAMSYIDYISDETPARYNQQFVKTKQYDSNSYWNENNVGTIWWDTSTSEYVPYYDTNIYPRMDDRLTHWGSLTDWSTIDVYEWTESDVHPSEWANKVKSDLTDPTKSDIADRASGDVRDPILFVQNRTWQQRAKKVGSTDAMLAIYDADTSSVYVSGSINSENTFVGLQSGSVNGEFSVDGSPTVVATGDDEIGLDLQPMSNVQTMSLTPDGTALGTLVLSKVDATSLSVAFVNGLSETVVLSMDNVSGNVVTFTGAGVEVNATFANDASSFGSDAEFIESIVDDIGQIGHKLAVRNRYKVDVIVPMTQLTIDSIHVNGTGSIVEYGEFIDVDYSDSIASNFEANPDVYNQVWSEWSPVVTEYFRFDMVDSNVFDLGKSLDASNCTIYINGVIAIDSIYSLNSSTLEIKSNSIKRGDKVTVVHHAITPKPDSIEFDITDIEKFELADRYKYEYEYVVKHIRNSDETVVPVYYFWVKNKQIASRGRELSLSNISARIANYDDAYSVIQNPVDGIYKTYVGVGLDRLVTQDDRYKISFVNDPTFRIEYDDMSRKNVHTEWVLIREDQKGKIPQVLWDKMVDSATGMDTAGNVIPSIELVQYDDRNDTQRQYGFGEGQTMIARDEAVKSIMHAILEISVDAPNNSLDFLNFGLVNEWFSTPDNTRKTLTDFWNNATAAHINRVFFTVFYDALSHCIEFKDVIKTSMIAAHSIQLLDVRD